MNLHRTSPLVLITLLTLAGPAAADDVSVGGDVEAIAAGSLDARVGSQSDSTSFGTTFGVGAHVDYRFHPMVSVGIAPRYITGIEPDAVPGESVDELDLRVRITAHRLVAPQVEAYGYLATGYSTIRMPEDATVANPSGLLLGAAAGVRYSTPSRLFVGGELGYQIGRQGTEMGGNDVDFSSQFLHLGLSAGILR